ncbi:MAG: hypothetical protein KJ634_00745 [Gammaproteobacteria bacterium]|nr:hypothetical protein [Gammaproteobacteria bacterium]MBU1414128.1 hypothetical protein [Gammaproteobacteria bacterium]
MENFLYSLAAAALGGLAFLAYRHPEAYSRIYGLITAAIVTAVAFMNGWNLAVVAILDLLTKRLPLETTNGVLQEVTDSKFSIFQSFALPMLFLAFHIFLSFLPTLIEKPRE